MTQPNKPTYDQYPPAPEEPATFGDSLTLLNSVAKGVDATHAGRPEVDAASSPWDAYGALGGEATQTFGVAPELPMPEVATPAREDRLPMLRIIAEGDKAEVSARDRRAEYRERKLAITEAKFDVSMDRDGIRSILDDNPFLLPKSTFGPLGGGEGDPDAERRADLQATLDAVAELPEDLHFEPGMTLVVGENGLGKSTFTRALLLALKVRDEYERDGGTGDFDAYRDKALDPEDFRLGGGMAESRPSPLALMIAKHINVKELESFGYHEYLDATVLNGQRNSNPGISDRHERGIDMDLRYGASHGQLNRLGLMGRLDEYKNSYERSKAEHEKHRNIGPGVITIDEAENGLSPKNHRKLKASIQEKAIEGSIVLFATNSELLTYDPTIRRIDLEHPELGVHKPSDHPEVYDLDEYTER